MIAPNPAARLAPRIVAVDPGSEESGVVVYDPEITSPVVHAFKWENRVLLNVLRDRAFAAESPDGPVAVSLTGPHVLVVETMRPRGQPMYRQVVTTLFWAGRFVEAWGGEWATLVRDEVKDYLVPRSGRGASGDSHVRAAIVERFGGTTIALSKPVRCGTCKGKGHLASGRGAARVVTDCSVCAQTGRVGAEGPLSHVSRDAWAALAVAVAWTDGLRTKEEAAAAAKGA